MRVEGPSLVPTPSCDQTSCTGGAAEWQGIQSFDLLHTGQSPKGTADGRWSPESGLLSVTYPGGASKAGAWSLVPTTPIHVPQTLGMAYK